VLTDRPMHRVDAYLMVRRRTAEAGLKGRLGCHMWPAQRGLRLISRRRHRAPAPRP
jgi:hypothetical protein